MTEARAFNISLWLMSAYLLALVFGLGYVLGASGASPTLTSPTDTRDTPAISVPHLRSRNDLPDLVTAPVLRIDKGEGGEPSALA